MVLPAASDYPAAQALAAGIVAGEALACAGSTAPDALWDAARSLRTRTLIGPFAVDASAAADGARAGDRAVGGRPGGTAARRGVEAGPGCRETLPPCGRVAHTRTRSCASLTGSGARAPTCPGAVRATYLILVAEAQLQATPVARVLPYYARFTELWPTPADMAAAELGEVLAEWQGLGYPRRARNLHAAARVVTASGWPERLTDLPGVGPYTAAAIRCFADGEDRAAGRHQRRAGRRAALPRRVAGRPAGAGLGGRAGDHGPRPHLVHRPRAPLRGGLPPARRVPRGRRRHGDRADARAPSPGTLRGLDAPAPGRAAAELAERGEASAGRDPEAAASLVADGLARALGSVLVRAR